MIEYIIEYIMKFIIIWIFLLAYFFWGKYCGKSQFKNAITELTKENEQLKIENELLKKRKK